jgi:hypothetical protein
MLNMTRGIIENNIQTVLINYAPAGLGCCDFAVFHPASRDVDILRPYEGLEF